MDSILTARSDMNWHHYQPRFVQERMLEEYDRFHDTKMSKTRIRRSKLFLYSSGLKKTRIPVAAFFTDGLIPGSFMRLKKGNWLPYQYSISNSFFYIRIDSGHRNI
jgi:hypothetical protein